jgi:hypothetical protein
MLRFVSRASTGARPRLASTDARARLSPARPMIARSEWLTLFTAFEGAADGLDPVRLQQALFLFSRCPGVPPQSKYAFEPGLYGPISDELYADLDRLVGERLLEPVPVKGAHWSLYKPIDATFERARRIQRQTENEDLEDPTRRLFEIKQYVSSVGFGELLERVYAEHPEFAVNSVFHRTA